MEEIYAKEKKKKKKELENSKWRYMKLLEGNL
jgi:hypothetical protein